MPAQRRFPCTYLAGPLLIDDVSVADAKGWRLSAEQLLWPGRVYDPTGCAARCGFDPAAMSDVQKLRVLSLNREVIRRCGVLIAYLAGPGRAFGTIREVEYARAHGVPVMVVADPVLASWETIDVEQHPTLSAACARAKELLPRR